MKIKMLKDVGPDTFPGFIMFSSDIVLYKDNIYEAKQNKHGAVYVICENGHILGVKPDEFVIVNS